MQWATEPARRPPHRRGRPGSRAALPLAGLGHGDRHDRAGRRPGARRPSGLGARRRVAARQGSARPGRLADPPAGRGAHRLALPVPQRVLSRSRRQRDGACWPSIGLRWPTTRPSRRPPDAASTGCSRCRIATAAGLPTTSTSTTRSSPSSPSPTTTPCSTRAVPISPPGSSSCSGTLGYRADHPSVARALDYLWSTQEPEGCWYGRWGVNYIYGTWQVLQGLKALDFPMDHPATQEGRGLARIDPAALGSLGRNLPELRRPEP